MKDVDWWQGTTINPTPRKVWNPKDWNIHYERGTFIKNSHLTALCDNVDWDPTVFLQNSDTTRGIIIRDKYTDDDDYVHLKLTLKNITLEHGIIYIH